MRDCWRGIFGREKMYENKEEMTEKAKTIFFRNRRSEQDQSCRQLLLELSTSRQTVRLMLCIPKSVLRPLSSFTIYDIRICGH